VDETASLELPSQEDVQSDLRSVVRGAVRLVIEMVLNEEVAELVGAKRYQRLSGRRDFRNGTYLRRLVTSMGLVELRVPRTREAVGERSVLDRYRRRTAELDDTIAEAYVRGVSTRKMAAVTSALMGESVSRSTVSRVTRSLAEEVEALRKSRIDEPMAYLFLDATFLDVRWARTVQNISALVAYGVGPEGKRRLLGITLGTEESEDSWSELLDQLVDRGLHDVRLVVSDDHKGLDRAVRKHLPQADRQRCIVHFERNILGKVPHRLRRSVAHDLVRIFGARTAEQAKRRAERFRTRWQPHVPEAVETLDAGLDRALTFLRYPERHHKRIRSTNGLERLHGEIKRRTRVVGSFPDRQGALRLITAVAIRATDIWAYRQYLDMSLLDAAAEEKAA
jgi:transposase-like protein